MCCAKSWFRWINWNSSVWTCVLKLCNISTTHIYLKAERSTVGKDIWSEFEKLLVCLIFCASLHFLWAELTRTGRQSFLLRSTVRFWKYFGFFFPFCREESVLSDLEVDYFDNAPCIELLTCQVCCTLCFLSCEQVKYINKRVWIRIAQTVRELTLFSWSNCEVQLKNWIAIS